LADTSDLCESPETMDLCQRPCNFVFHLNLLRSPP
jgi:hypothetical protein